MSIILQSNRRLFTLSWEPQQSLCIYFTSNWESQERILGFLMALSSKDPPTMQKTQERGRIPESEDFPGRGNGYALQYSFPKNPMGRGACQATVQRIPKTLLSNWAQNSTREGHKAMFKLIYNLINNATLQIPN